MRAPRALVLCSIFVLLAGFVVGCGDDRGSSIVAPTTGFEAPSSPAIGRSVAPAGYYDTVVLTDPASMRFTLHEVIDDHTRFPYSSSSTDTWDILEQADEDPQNPSNILDLYRNASYPKAGGGNTNYNREHTWAKSYGFPNDGSTNYPYTDCHHLFLCDSGYNSSRSNKPFRFCDGSCTEKVTLLTNGVGGGSGVYPGNSNWTTGSFTSGTWEVWKDRRGDVARALFYMDVRYEGGTHNVTGAAEPDLILTDDEALIAASNTGSNESVAYMGMLTVLLQWHVEDPVDDKERHHNDVVFSYQGNRNPFVDHPEWVDCIFLGTCAGGGDTTPPAAPTALVATGGDGSIDLDWADNTETDLAGYNVYRATASGGPFSLINGGLVSLSAYSDTGLTNGVTYYYQVTAVDTASNESSPSSQASATPQGGGGGTPGVAWINEFHYDNASTDTGEFVEIAGGAGTDLTGWTVIGYNGNGGGGYKTVALSGVINDQGSGFGALSFDFSSMQNGAPDGLALVDATGTVVEFLSYEGSFTATDGPAVGLVSTDVGVAESSSTPVGDSLQRTGTGSIGTDFSWTGPTAASPGAINAGQSFGGGTPPDTTPPAAPSGLLATAHDGSVDLDWADNSEPDLDGYDVFRSTTSGGPWTQVNPSRLSVSAFTDNGVSNGTTYFYVVRATDTTGNVSSDSGEVSATPQDMTPPAAPAGVVATAGDAVVDLDWADNAESDLAGYNVLRSTTPGGGYVQVNGSLLAASLFSDSSVTNGTTYYYVIEAVDLVGNVSGSSAEVSATPEAPPVVVAGAWINEFHYDNDGKDRNEFVEVAGAAGTDLSGWTLVAYNGKGGSVYETVGLSGTIPDLQNGYGVLGFSFSKLQNGSPDGIALVDDTGAVVEFLSYEGSFTATDGPAAGVGSTDVGVSEGSGTSKNQSLQRVGTGLVATDFTWQGPSSASRGAINAGQSFAAPGGQLARTGQPVRGPAVRG